MNELLTQAVVHFDNMHGECMDEDGYEGYILFKLDGVEFIYQSTAVLVPEHREQLKEIAKEVHPSLGNYINWVLEEPVGYTVGGKTPSKEAFDVFEPYDLDALSRFDSETCTDEEDKRAQALFIKLDKLIHSMLYENFMFLRVSKGDILFEVVLGKEPQQWIGAQEVTIDHMQDFKNYILYKDYKQVKEVVSDLVGSRIDSERC